MLVEIHMLKNYAPSNLNRDDTGAPKNCMFGGVQRGRISSQCLKRTWRTSEYFQEEIGKEHLGIRTRCLPDLVLEKLSDSGFPEEYLNKIRRKLTGIGNSDGSENKKNDKTAQIVFYTPEDITAVAEKIREKMELCASAKEVGNISVKELQADMKKGNARAITLDMALFGRMVTSDAFADVEAAMQVAHAISTNRVILETDFFTAVDDQIAGSEETGSGMMGDVDYNSSCYYFYASLDLEKLRENLESAPEREELMKKVLPVLIETMAFSNPGGKQNTFAAHSLPSAILIECKEKKVPVSYANAFEIPVFADRKGGLILHSVEKLAEQEEKMREIYGLPVEKRLWFTTEKVSLPEEAAVTCTSFNELISALSEM